MKRITKIEIENFRAFFGSYTIDLPKGENLLIYGENGSGKSSFFKALNNYMASSRNAALPFNKNHHRPPADNGLIRISFSDANPATQVILPGTNQTLDFSSAASTNNVLFVQNGDLIKGFLDYRNLLDVYNHKEPIPNLFKLIVTELLLEHFPIGGTEPIGRKYLRLQSDLLNVRTRRVRQHQNALAELPGLQTEIESTLRRIFRRVNLFLLKYFKKNLRVDFALTPLTYNYQWNNWHINSDLRLTLRLNGVLITNHQDVLNEARLSALATCIYLAAVLENPQIGFDLKVLFLDDVFIGLDTGNRLPIINILTSEFGQHQIFLATYDRQWYELAQRFFNSHLPEKWKSVELYTTNETVGRTTFEVPVILPYEENFDKAVYYLHHKTKPDYPAAANFFRKSAEELLKAHIPTHEVRDDNYALIETYKLGALINSGLHFLNKIGANNLLLLQLQNSLPSLLHPLSHYDLAAQVYKGELEEVQKLLPLLAKHLIDLKSIYRVFIPQGRMFKLNFTINATDTGHYEIHSKETIYALRNAAGIITVSIGDCHCKTCYTMNGVTETSRYNFANTDPIAQYTSVENSYDTIYNHIHGLPAYAHIARVANCYTEFEYHDHNGMHTIEHHKTLVVW